jgi:hypothetical protein
MATKQVEMAVRDPKTKKLVVDEVEVQIVRVNVRNRDRRSGGHVFNDVISGPVYFKPGEVKTLEISKTEAIKLKERKNATFELTTAAPTLPALAEDDEEEASEPTSSAASMMAEAAEAAEEQPAGELLDEPPRVQRRTKR